MLNSSQRKAVEITEGPLLIIAGPGTGKTYTLVQRAVHLIVDLKVAPESILIATFTEKAAKELLTRLSNEFAENNVNVDVNEMYVGTFHSLCLRILKDNLEYTDIKKNYRVLDQFDQQYLIMQHIKEFKAIEGYGNVIAATKAWSAAGKICSLVNNLVEELVDAQAMRSDDDENIVTAAKITEKYSAILRENNSLDFSSLQVNAYKLLKETPQILHAYQEKLQYLMIDEYQDTNYIQEQLVFMLAGERKNICVVGDDDQGLYRFRGATIRNILEFPKHFYGACQKVKLEKNYRSDRDIISFYNNWMKTTEGRGWSFSWKEYRFDKNIVPARKKAFKSPAVVKITAKQDFEGWKEKILAFIEELKATGKIKDYNQIAFLFNSVKSDTAQELAFYLERNGINVYSPRSDMFFGRREIILLIGALQLCFPKFVQSLEEDEISVLSTETDAYGELKGYYKYCQERVEKLKEEQGMDEFFSFLAQKGQMHLNLDEPTDYAFSGLMYQLIALSPFREYLDADMNSGVVDLRPARNIAIFSSVLSKFEYLHNVSVFSPEKIDMHIEKFFMLYLRLLLDNGINEYEDDSEYAPSGCVSFLTIHQSKGMEFPIVFIGSLWGSPYYPANSLLSAISAKYFHRKLFEPAEDIKYFDFWRLYYTAFSRAQDLLVLTYNENYRVPSKFFCSLCEKVPSADSEEFDINDFDFKEVKDVNIKERYSFTSHIAVYDTCSLQYKFFKELNFTQVRYGATLFGMLIHETIEDIHRAALKHEESSITNENIETWLLANYASLSKREHQYLGQPQINTALEQVIRYAENQRGKWNLIQEAEVEVNLVNPDYIIDGTIDLIRGDNDTVDIIDFKSEKKPDIEQDKKRVNRYKKQLELYAHLVEKKTGKKISKMHLYFTGENDGVPTISFEYNNKAVAKTVKSFDKTVHKIMNKDFTAKTRDKKTCQNCDFRYYCKKEKG